MAFQNNSIVGFTLQNLICKKYRITPRSKHAESIFKKCYEPKLKDQLDILVNKIFILPILLIISMCWYLIFLNSHLSFE